ncbi:uncharacterized protein TwdlZ [Drosophila tropicalis]|uniref:uncharacterized protein TwdlZ n=1 Tax=Drosophila tropicalis TaxID=46794 RepID=UPI0035AC2118
MLFPKGSGSSSGYILVLLCLLQQEQQLAKGQSRSYLPSINGQDTAPNVAAPIITKQFFTISAAEDEEDKQPRTKHLVIGQPRRNYRIIFIRAPTGGSDQLKYTAELAPQEERTVVYVLTRKQQELQAEDIVAQPRPESEHRPEIFFIKYRTHEEAAAAQREIQTQYDQLGGNTEQAAPYVAPIQSVIGSLNAKDESANAPYAGVASGAISGSGGGSGGSGYHYPAPPIPPMAVTNWLAPPNRGIY